jgi:hypothetical protein
MTCAATRFKPGCVPDMVGVELLTIGLLLRLDQQTVAGAHGQTAAPPVAAGAAPDFAEWLIGGNGEGRQPEQTVCRVAAAQASKAAAPEATEAATAATSRLADTPTRLRLRGFDSR